MSCDSGMHALMQVIPLKQKSVSSIELLLNMMLLKLKVQCWGDLVATRGEDVNCKQLNTKQTAPSFHAGKPAPV